jgi:hypothetical protein
MEAGMEGGIVTAGRLRIRHFNADLVKIMRIRNNWPTDPPRLQGEPSRLHCEPPWLEDFDADPAAQNDSIRICGL